MADGFARNAIRISDGVKDNEADVINQRLQVSASIKDTNGQEWLINDRGQGHVVMTGLLDTGNSTEALLTAGSTFTGTGIDVSDYSAITMLIHTDVNSANDGLVVQFSSDNSDWHDGEAYTIIGGSTKFFTPPVQSKYMRITYTNGSEDQTEFHIHTMLKKQPVKWSSHNINETISEQDDAELVKAVLTGKDKNAVFQNVTTTPDGDLKISDNSSGLSIAQGKVTDASFIHKFGNAPDFDTGDNAVTVWDGAADGTAYEKMVYNYSSTADIDSISSSNSGDTQKIEIQGVDGSYNLINQTVTLNGQNRVALTTDLLRVFRMKNHGATDLAGNVFCYVNGAITGGVPDDANDIRAIITQGNNQTLMAIYTIPRNKRGYMRDWYASTAGANKSSNYIIKLKAREVAGVFQLKHVSSIADNGTSSYQHTYNEPEVFDEKTDIEMTAQITATGVTAASISAGFDLVLEDDPTIIGEILLETGDNLLQEDGSNILR